MYLVHGALQPSIHRNPNLPQKVQASFSFQLYCLWRENVWKMSKTHITDRHNFSLYSFNILSLILFSHRSKTHLHVSWAHAKRRYHLNGLVSCRSSLQSQNMTDLCHAVSLTWNYDNLLYFIHLNEFKNTELCRNYFLNSLLFFRCSLFSLAFSHSFHQFPLSLPASFLCRKR